ncbi:MAG: hypothetical protein KC470_02920 [Dehalococcoidia bacterium]|nr:hypothetical protein [Dehalococcoidia bacterium]
MRIAQGPWPGILLLAVVFGLQALTAISPGIHAPFVNALGLSGHDLLGIGAYRLTTSSLVQSRAGFVGTVWVTLAIVGPLAIWRLGSLKTLAVFFFSDAAGSLAVLVPLGIIAAFGSSGAQAGWSDVTVGSSSGTYALGLAVGLSLHGRARALSIVTIITVFGVRLVFFTDRFDVEHAAALAFTGGLTLWWSRRTPSRRAQAVRNSS